MVISNEHTTRPPDGPRRPPPAIDERLIMPETRYEAIDGEVVYVSPAEPPHASRHSKLSALLEAHVAPGYDAASDMLTRTSEKGDMAPDGSIYPTEVDPETDGRQIERLAFEVVSTESLAHAGRKAAALRARGVARVFAIDVERRRALEWSAETDAWSMLLESFMIEDPCLVTPLPVAALVGAASADDAIARALIAKGNPVIAQVGANRFDAGREAGREEGRLAAARGAIRTVLAARGLALLDHEARRLDACDDGERLGRWLARAATATANADVFDGA